MVIRVLNRAYNFYHSIILFLLPYTLCYAVRQNHTLITYETNNLAVAYKYLKVPQNISPPAGNVQVAIVRTIMIITV
ncbi:hypothetical protein B0H34DRAFT_690311 [Crassisporium funariophilum]|nr:hypothetical protein B0H34DRAFT_690311 [Crassisporium funariophilum]